MAALLRTLAGSGRNVQGTAAPVHSSLCRNATPVEHRSIMGRGFTEPVAHAPHLNSGKEPRVRTVDEAGRDGNGPDRPRLRANDPVRSHSHASSVCPERARDTPAGKLIERTAVHDA
jgi:hypothetical protein